MWIFNGPGRSVRGFTLLETVAALALAALVTGLGAGLLLHASARHLRISTETELLENARAADLYLREFLRAAESVTLTTASDGSLRTLLTHAGGETATFRFDKSLAPGHARYRRLSYNEYNEVAAHIADITARHTPGRLTLTVVTADSLAPGGPRGTPVTAVIVVDLTRKIFIQTND